MIVRALALALLLFCASAHALRGEVVLLLRTPNTSQANLEALNRLKGELSLHGFTVVLLNVPNASGPRQLEALADENQAVASVEFSSTGGQGEELGPVDIWLSDRVTGTTSKRTIQPGTGRDAPSILAVRALELLRSSLRSSEAAPPQKDRVGAHPKRAKLSVKKLERPERRYQEFFLSAGGAMAWGLPDGSPTLGPALGFGYQKGRTELGLFLLGPSIGKPTNAPGGNFRATFFSAQLAPTIYPVLTDSIAFSLFPSLGVTLLSIDGEALTPYAGRTDSRWLFSLGGGFAGQLRLADRLSLELRAGAIQLLPSPRVRLVESTKHLGSPLLTASIGIRLSL